MKLINPATEEVIQDILEDTQEAVKAKFKSLQEGQKAWAQTPLTERLACLERFGALIEENKQELAKILTMEMGKPIRQALNEIQGAAGRITYFIQNTAQWSAPEVTVPEGKTRETVRYEPLGVIGNISAWNYPYNVGYNVFIPALATGNAVLYKPSEHAVLTGLQMERLLHEAGVPQNVFKTAVGGKQVGEYLLQLPLNGFFFTGSYQTGVHIATSVAHKLVPVQLELGGKDPLYVADDIADIDQAAANAVEGKFYNAGQSCCAVERIYVHEKVYKAFIKAFVQHTEALRVGDPMREETDMGPLARKEQLDFLKFQLNDALDKGATLLVGDETLETNGYFFEPTVLVDVDHTMSLMIDETFGPLVGIQQVKSDEEAIALMNDTAYGLSAAVFSSSQERAEAILAQVDAGTVYWNCCDRVSPSSPWSGRKHSGLGSTLSHQGIRAFLQPKAYHLRD
jgi:acyl-CoA reductase-like NAD-dependent aldehyde dehydrogenase